MILLKNVYLNGKEQDVLIEQNKISKIAGKIEAGSAEVFNCSGKAILPTFCNMHTHASMMFLRGVGEDLPLFDWLEKEIWPREAKLTEESIYYLSKFAMLEMIKTGTTMFLDMYFYIKSTIQALKEMGLRGAVTYVGMDMFDEKEAENRISAAQKFLNTDFDTELLVKGLSCHAVYTTSEKLFREFKKLCRQKGLILNVHASETQKEVDDCLPKHGQRPVELLDSWGVLDEKTVLAHAVHLNEHEIELVKKSGAIVAHNPASNLKLNSGQMPLQHYLDKGLRVTLGTDGVSSNNSLSMIDEMKIAAFSAKNVANDSTAAKVQDVFDMATKNGFEALGLKAGQIKEGYLADFMLVDLNNFALLPNVNLISNMVYAADSSCITDVFCNGKCLMKDKYVPNEEKIVSDFKRVCEDLL
ncbi:MAG TPA: N-ethylammeline chlorohydrolase [Alphaproteobacteria bacterium]|nr:N-ethylammeline chlorohydrolase [Alphaproteobacteria bacterium]